MYYAYFYSYRENETQIYRLHNFILRDVVAIRESLRLESQPMLFPDNTDLIVTIFIMLSMADYEIRQLHLLNDLRPFFNKHAVHIDKIVSQVKNL